MQRAPLSVPGASVDDKARLPYTKMSQGLLATGKPIVFEAATLGDTRVTSWIWGPAVSNLWRTTGDISASFTSMLRNFTANSALAQYAGPGHWNDADMLEVGTGAFSTLAADAHAGDANVKVASVSSAAVGSALRIGTTTGPKIVAPTGPIGAQATEATGIPVSFTTSGPDAFGTALTSVCTTAWGATFPIGPIHVTCTATDTAGRSASASFDVNVLPPPHPLEVSGTVPATLSLTLGGAASFGAFAPGVEHEYTAQTTANVISTAGDATLTVSDPGHLANGAFELPQPLRVEMAPASLTRPVSNASVAITFRQAIGANDALRTGSYSKTLTFTLSTTAP